MGTSECKKIVGEDIPKYQFDFMMYLDILAATSEDILLGNIC